MWSNNLDCSFGKHPKNLAGSRIQWLGEQSVRPGSLYVTAGSDTHQLMTWTNCPNFICLSFLIYTIDMMIALTLLLEILIIKAFTCAYMSSS